MRNSIAFLSVLAFAWVGQTLSKAFPQSTSIELRVLGDSTEPIEDSIPVANAIVYCLLSEGTLQVGQTDANGSLRFEHSESATDITRTNRDWIWVYHPEYNLFCTVTNPIFRGKETQTIRMVRASAKKQTVYFGRKRIAGAVVRPIELASEPIPEPLREKLQATTNADGEVEFAGFPGNSYGDVEVRAKGFGVQTLQARGAPLHGIKTAPVGTLSLRGVGRVRGKLIADDLTLLKGLKLQFESHGSDGVFGAAVGRADVTEFAPDGSFEIPEIAYGKLNFIESRDSQIPYQVRHPSPDVMQVHGGMICRLNLSLERLVTVTGDVQFEDGTPVPDAAVFFTSPPNSVRTDQLGRYKLQQLPGDCDCRVSNIRDLDKQIEPGKLRLRNWEQKHQPKLTQFEIPQTTEVVKLPTIVILRQRTVPGRLVDAEGKPLEYMTVFAYRTSATGDQQILSSALTDSKGEFDLQVCSPTDSYEYLYDCEKMGLAQSLVARVLPIKPVNRPSSNSKDALLIENSDAIVLQAK